jgi:dynactin-4
LEVVPGFLKQHHGLGTALGGEKNKADLDTDLPEDEDIVEIPIFVRIEYESDVAVEDRAPGTEHSRIGGKEKREEAFWCVLGAGRIKSQL